MGISSRIIICGTFYTHISLLYKSKCTTLYRNEEKRQKYLYTHIKHFVNVTYGVSHHQPPSFSYPIRFDLNRGSLPNTETEIATDKQTDMYMDWSIVAIIMKTTSE